MGREMSQFSDKIPSWEALFKMSPSDFQRAGVEPARKRRYLLWCRERFRQAIWGVGGDCKYVSEDGIAYLTTVEVPSGKNTSATVLRSPGMKKIVVNVPPPNVPYTIPDTAREPKGIYLSKLDVISGTSVEILKGSDGQWAKLVNKGALWWHREGTKPLGGERRRAQTLSKLRQEERKQARAAKGR
jgi:hypothetical protein